MAALFCCLRFGAMRALAPSMMGGAWRPKRGKLLSSPVPATHDNLVEALKSAAETLEQLVRLNRISANSKGLRDARAAPAQAGA